MRAVRNARLSGCRQSKIGNRGSRPSILLSRSARKLPQAEEGGGEGWAGRLAAIQARVGRHSHGDEPEG
jgi:hypothetical protein